MRKPPLILVKTWYQILTKAEEPEARQHAEKMLLNVFGTHEAVAEYLKKHKVM